MLFPVRNTIKGVVERVFKRGTYRVEEELQRFTMSMGLCDEVPALEKFTRYVDRLLGPSGIHMVKNPQREGEGPSPPLAEGAKGEGTLARDADIARVIAAAGGPLWQHLEERRSSIYGFELSDRGLLGEETGLSASLFLPILSESRCTHIVVLLEKWNRVQQYTEALRCEAGGGEFSAQRGAFKYRD